MGVRRRNAVNVRICHLLDSYRQAQHDEHVIVTLSLSKCSITYLFLHKVDSIVRRRWVGEQATAPAISSSVYNFPPRFAHLACLA